MSTPEVIDEDRRKFLRHTSAASTGAALGAFALAGAASAESEMPADAVRSGSGPAAAAAMSEEEISKLPRVKQTLVAPPFFPKHDQVADGGPKVVEVTLTAEEKKMVVDDDDTEIVALTFNGTMPGPMIVVHQDDYVELTLKNPAESEMAHNIDFHASTGALGGGELTYVGPGEEAVLRFKATKPGVFVYHCAPGGQMIPYHVVHGMNGAIMVLPRDGLMDGDGNPIKYDRAYFVGEQDLYVPKDESGEYKKYDTAGENFTDVMPLLRTLTPTHIVFNGKVGALTGDNAMKAKVGETVLIVHAQANRDTRPHLIGGHGDYVWEQGSFADRPATGLETWFIRGGSAGAAVYTFRQPGLYAYLNHNLIEAVELGAASHFVVEGEWNDDLMKQVKEPSPIEDS